MIVHTPPASLAAGTVSSTSNNKRTIEVDLTTATFAVAASKALKAAKSSQPRSPPPTVPAR